MADCRLILSRTQSPKKISFGVVVIVSMISCGSLLAAEEVELDFSNLTILALLFQTPVDASDGMMNPAAVVWRIKDLTRRGLHYELALKGNELSGIVRPVELGKFSWQVRSIANLLVADGGPAQYDHGELMKGDQYCSSFVGIEVEGSYNIGSCHLRLTGKPYYNWYQNWFSTGDAFVLPTDNWTTILRAELAYEQYRLLDLNDVGEGKVAQLWFESVNRDRWAAWGSPDRWFGDDTMKQYRRWGGELKAGFPIVNEDRDNLQLSISFGDSKNCGQIGKFKQGSAIEGGPTKPLHGYFYMEIWSERYLLGTVQYSIMLHKRVRVFGFGELLCAERGLDYPRRQTLRGLGLGIRVATWKGLPIKVIYGYGRDADRPATTAGHELFVMVIAAF